jgi:hypothetical protein
MKGKLNFGIEYEYFVVDNNGKFVPPYRACCDLDGNALIAEIRTHVHPSLTDAVFELEMLLYKEDARLNKKGFSRSDQPCFTITPSTLAEFRQSGYANFKYKEFTDEKSIYPRGKLGKQLSQLTLKASLQINISNNVEVARSVYYMANAVNGEKVSCTKRDTEVQSVLFDYPSIIFALDVANVASIRAAKRVKGVYSIKEGELGTRIEYRSLPNNASLNFLKRFKI